MSLKRSFSKQFTITVNESELDTGKVIYKAYADANVVPGLNGEGVMVGFAEIHETFLMKDGHLFSIPSIADELKAAIFVTDNMDLKEMFYQNGPIIDHGGIAGGSSNVDGSASGNINIA